jgi:hypothetical protein
LLLHFRKKRKNLHGSTEGARKLDCISSLLLLARSFGPHWPIDCIR